MNKIFYKSGQWFAFKAPEPLPKKHILSKVAKSLDNDRYNEAKAAALLVLNPEIIPNSILDIAPLWGKEYDWPGTMKLQISKYDGESDGYMLELPNSADSYTEGAEQFPNTPNNASRNWDEDYPHENGRYQNKCMECKELFFGHKRRVICKVCFNKPPDWEKMAEKKAPIQHENWAWQGCWADGEMTGYAKCMVKKVKPLEAENESLKQSLRELIPLANEYTDLLLAFEPWREEGTKPTIEEIKEYVAAIDRAKSKLT